MPYKFDETRRHNIPMGKYRVTNWPEYAAAMAGCEILSVWIPEEAVAAWQAPPTGKRGGQPIYSAIAEVLKCAGAGSRDRAPGSLPGASALGYGSDDPYLVLKPWQCPVLRSRLTPTDDLENADPTTLSEVVVGSI